MVIEEPHAGLLVAALGNYENFMSDCVLHARLDKMCKKEVRKDLETQLNQVKRLKTHFRQCYNSLDMDKTKRMRVMIYQSIARKKEGKSHEQLSEV